MKLTHPESDVTVEADERNVDMYLSQGWQKTDEKPDGKSGKKS